MKLLMHFLRRTEGQDLIEYTLLASLISVSVVLVLGPLGSKISNSYQRIGTTLSAPGSSGSGAPGNGNGNGNNGQGNGNGNGNGGGNGNGNNGNGNGNGGSNN